MNATYVVTFKGFPDKPRFASELDKMLRRDIAAYPSRMRMESASVTLDDAKPKRQYNKRQPKVEPHAES